jgi:signal transduction histidine kinase
MSLSPKPPETRRRKTDESLRVERERADQALQDELAAIDETADAVISRARSRADEVLAAARKRIDRETITASPQAHSVILRERARDDQVLRDERTAADTVLREEREEKSAVLANERRDTDTDLRSERTASDDAVATRDEFLGIVSHDLRHMLNAVVGFSALITKVVADENHEEEVLRYAQRIQRSGVRMNRLIGDLLDVVSINAGQLAVTSEPGNADVVITEAVETFLEPAAASGISLTTEIPSTLPPALFDHARILQVLSNLLSNAIKFSPPGSTVVLRVERDGDHLRFAVADRGIGIALDQANTIFMRFVQLTKTQRRGVGLGLYISKCIVQGHGGRIWVESEPGKGSTFFFTIPIVQESRT